MPPVREASTKPSAATVLPAPVACSNQKRRAAPASSSIGVGRRLLLGLLGGIPVERLLVRQLVALELDLARVELLERGAALAVAADQELGLERDQRARQRVHLVGRQRGAVGQVRLLLGQQPLEPQHQRELAPPLDRRLGAAGVHLLQRGVERRAARGCSPPARWRRPRLRARRIRARIPRRASVHRRKPARHRPRSFSQPRIRRSSIKRGRAELLVRRQRGTPAGAPSFS